MSLLNKTNCQLAKIITLTKRNLSEKIVCKRKLITTYFCVSVNITQQYLK